MEDKKLIDSVLKKVQHKIAISEFGKVKEMKPKKNVTNYYIITKRVAIVLLAISIITVASVQAKKIVNEFVNREVYATTNIKDSIRNGFAENLEMEYQYSDGIGLKVNSLLMSDNDINVVLDFKLNDRVDLQGKNLQYGYMLYNEKKELYYVSPGTNTNLLAEFRIKNIFQTRGKADELPFQSARSSYITYTKENIIVNELVTAQSNFPKAKKIFIEVVGIGYQKENGAYEKLTNSRWKIELIIPEKFYETTSISYQLKEKIEGINIEQAFVSDTSMTFIGVIEGINGSWYHNIAIIDENETTYEAREITYNIDGNKDGVSINFPINKNMLTEKLYLRTYVKGEEKILELIKK